MKSPLRTGRLQLGHPLLSIITPTVMLYSLPFKWFNIYSIERYQICRINVVTRKRMNQVTEPVNAVNQLNRGVARLKTPDAVERAVKLEPGIRNH
jgi:hypothetical protein